MSPDTGKDNSPAAGAKWWKDTALLHGDSRLVPEMRTTHQRDRTGRIEMDQLVDRAPDRWAPQRRLGVVDGLGPRTTARFYAMLCEHHRALTGGASPDVLVHTISVQRHLAEADSAGSFRPAHQEAMQHLVARTCRSLAGSGADVIAVACNATTVDAATAAPTYIGMVEATSRALQHLDVRRVGLIASSIMVSSAAYGRGLGEAGITVVAPAPRDQEIVDRFIESVQWSPTPVPVPEELVRVIARLSDDVDALVVDSADLDGVVDTEVTGKPVIDSVRALVEESCRALLGPVPHTGATPDAVRHVAAGDPSATGSRSPSRRAPSHWRPHGRRSGEPVNLSGLAISHRAQTFPSRTVSAVIRGIISRYPSEAGQPAV
jgi:aspartate/glutamate racemase